MIELRNIGKVYQTKGVRTCGVQNLSLSIEEGEFVMILGRSGCGKSTLLNILGGIDRPTQGEYLFRGTPVSRLKGKELAAFRNKHIGYIFQGYCLVEELDALHNVELPRDMRECPPGTGGAGPGRRWSRWDWQTG